MLCFVCSSGMTKTLNDGQFFVTVLPLDPFKGRRLIVYVISVAVQQVDSKEKLLSPKTAKT